MKMLICTDGSKHSHKAIEKASIIAEGGRVSEAAFINVYNIGEAMPFKNQDIAGPQMESLQKIISELKKQGKKILSDAKKKFGVKNIKIWTILKEGNPADTIVNFAREEKFDMIVVGSRGLGGLRKLILGSVSHSIVQEAEDCSVLVVK